MRVMLLRSWMMMMLAWIFMIKEHGAELKLEHCELFGEGKI